VWDGETSVDACMDNLSNVALGKTEEESRLDFWRTAGSLIVGWKRRGQKLRSTILRAVARLATIAPQQTMRCLNSS